MRMIQIMALSLAFTYCSKNNSSEEKSAEETQTEQTSVKPSPAVTTSKDWEPVIAEMQAKIKELQMANAGLADKVNSQEIEIDALKASGLSAAIIVEGLDGALVDQQKDIDYVRKLQKVLSLNEGTVTFSGVNVHINNGLDETEKLNGLGNVIIGFNSKHGDFGASPRSGSHNLILGDYNQYRSYGSIVSGRNNQANGPGSIISGIYNIAQGESCAAIGGWYNTVSGDGTAVIGGVENSTDGLGSVIAGGGGDYVDRNGGFIAGIKGASLHNGGNQGCVCE